MAFIADFVEDQSGASAIEYALVAAVVSLAAFGAMAAMGNTIDNIFTDINSKLDEANG